MERPRVNLLAQAPEPDLIDSIIARAGSRGGKSAAEHLAQKALGKSSKPARALPVQSLLAISKPKGR